MIALGRSSSDGAGLVTLEQVRLRAGVCRSCAISGFHFPSRQSGRGAAAGWRQASGRRSRPRLREREGPTSASEVGRIAPKGRTAPEACCRRRRATRGRSVVKDRAFAILFYMSIGFAGYYRYICMVLTVRKVAKETGHCCRESRGEGTRRESLKYEESDNHCD